MERECPSHIGKYTNIRYLAEGGMGAVYLAKDPVLKHDVVIKQLKFGRKESKERFKKEISIMNKLTNDYIVRSFEFMEEVDERTGRKKEYFVLEYVDGMSLEKLMEKDKLLPLNVSMLIFHDACMGLHYAHNRDIVHRDIKPANILISKRTPVKIADFGIAGIDKEPEEEKKKEDNGKGGNKHDSIYGGNMTIFGSTMGTLSFMAPEQMVNAALVTKRADIYSMGITLYQMIYAKKPYDNKRSLAEQKEMLKKMGCIKPPKTNGKEKIPFSIRCMIRKMTKFYAKKRYKNLTRVIEITRKYLAQFEISDIKKQLAMSMQRYPDRPYKYAEIPLKNRTPKIVALVVLGVALLAGLITFAWKEGYIHKTILRHWYTPVTINLKMPETKSVKADLPARVFFYYNDNDKLPDVPGSQRDFSVSKNQDKDKGSTIVSIKPVYLKHGDYRIKIAAGPSVWWTDVQVTHDELKLDLDYLKGERRNIKIHATALDDETGKDISDICSCKIQTDKGLEDLWTINPNSLKTGEVYKIYIKSNGYQDEYFSLLIDWYQDELYINARMKKLDKTDGAGK